MMLLVILPASAQTPFQFQDVSVAPGTKQHFLVPIEDVDTSTFIPITVFHGQAPGPVLGITAGVHGYEYSPILAGQVLINRINPASLSGTVLLVQVASIGSFLGRSPYTSALDGKNLNRVFPGDPEGTVTERVADFISKSVIPRCTHFVDAHSGDAPEDLTPYSVFYRHKDRKELSQQAQQIAQYLGFEYARGIETSEVDYMQPENQSRYCSAEAFKQGIPAADIECGRLGMVEEAFVDRIVYGLTNLMHGLGMTGRKPDPTPEIWFIEDRSFLSSNHTGFFYPSKAAGDYVRKGMKIGYITDFFNAKLEDIYSDTDGIILYMLGTPPVNRGETLASIAILE